MDITSHEVKGAVQYLIVAVFADGSGHHQHDGDPRFQAWNEQADEYQIADAWPSEARPSSRWDNGGMTWPQVTDVRRVHHPGRDRSHPPS
jgi:hypothetical protein